MPKGKEKGMKTESEIETEWNATCNRHASITLSFFSVFKTSADASQKGYILANVENKFCPDSTKLKLGII